MDAAWLMVGVLLGLLVGSLVFALIAGSYIGADMDAFRKWVDGL